MAETDTVVARLPMSVNWVHVWDVLQVTYWGWVSRDKPVSEHEMLTEQAKLVHSKYIARLQAENEALRRERDEARKEAALFASRTLMLSGMVAQSDANLTLAEAAREAAEAEAARLREALHDRFDSWWRKYYDGADLARGAACDAWCSAIDAAPVQPGPSMRETMWGEVVDDDYEGIAFRLTEEGNRDGHHFLKEITLAAETFPLGTKITIAEPVQQAAPSGEGE